jgi:hypothetical protein
VKPITRMVKLAYRKDTVSRGQRWSGMRSLQKTSAALSTDRACTEWPGPSAPWAGAAACVLFEPVCHSFKRLEESPLNVRPTGNTNALLWNGDRGLQSLRHAFERSFRLLGVRREGQD